MISWVPSIPLALLLTQVAICKACPVWTIYNSTDNKCKCGDSLGKVIYCDTDTLEVFLSHCYCMTHSEELNTTVAGPCVITCVDSEYFNPMNKLRTKSVHQLNQQMCGRFQRTGQLCGKCIDNYSLPVYSYTQECVHCTKADFRYNLIKYICVAFLPLTIFYCIVILFKVSITSGKMTGYVLTCQILSSPVIIRSVLTAHVNQNIQSKLALAFFTIWNLDFFRSLYSPFCIHPEMNAMQVLVLDYIIAVYPLFLIVLTYIAISLHDRYSMIVRLWRPVYRAVSCFRREWNIRGSLIQAFASFMVLSSVKILTVSFDLLLSISLTDVRGYTSNQTYLYYAANIAYFESEHLPYGIVAIAMLTVFAVLPVILLLLYPCQCFQRCLNCCKVKSQLLFTVMDAFQGCYRHTPRDCRYFAGIYYCLRIVCLCSSSPLKSRAFPMLISCYFAVLAIVVLFIEPYKNKLYNKIDNFCFVLATVMCFCYTFVENDSTALILIGLISSSILIIFLLFACVLVVQKILPQSFINVIKYCWRNDWRKEEQMKQTIVEEEHENSPLLK